MTTADDAEFRRAVAEFNEGRFFECHDTLEAIWMESSGEEKRFLQGLIQVSVGYYHFFNGNPSGALSQWGKGTEKLSGFGPEHAGLDLERLLAGIGRWSGLAEAELSGKRMPAEGAEKPRLEFNHNTQRRQPWPQ
jgi:predicted metal-dependent hydrolase